MYIYVYESRGDSKGVSKVPADPSFTVHGGSSDELWSPRIYEINVLFYKGHAVLHLRVNIYKFNFRQ